MLAARAVIGGIVLFLGRELNFLFAAAMAALLSFRLIPFLPRQWPGWFDYVLMLGLAVIAGMIPIVNERLGYIVSGFIAGGTFLVEYVAPGDVILPVAPFLFGGILGAFTLGIFTDWALILISCLIGAYYLTSLFALAYIPKMLVGSGLFIIGTLTQALMRRSQDDR